MDILRISGGTRRCSSTCSPPVRGSPVAPGCQGEQTYKESAPVNEGDDAHPSWGFVSLSGTDQNGT